ncbi:MAG: hypothetical protein ETSY1_15385 [Candidatus Entotheonella factor]|uniref:Glycosyltransferase 2-like domain-containing protein n=1 Tax=Entotheonella factor TaxID=1429438 RepID=W4LMP2_ENTF1|nr:MAG: hypothetical protein ETSY1_15385 [Candidatus Entotheonella factor]
MTTLSPEGPACPAARQVSLVIIGRNEEQFIRGAIASALAAAAHVTPSEVLYVDSASTDRTVEYAKAFPIRILQLKPEWTLTPAAGRYTGFRHTAGEYVFFIDGDTEVEGPWLASAIEFLRTHPEYGAVAGVVNEIWVDRDGNHIGGQDNIFGQDLSAKVWDVKSLGGIAVYRRCALEQAGNFNPFVPAGEEREVALRIRMAGFKLARIEGVMGCTHADNRQSWREIVRRFNTSFYDYGVLIRYSAVYGAGLKVVLEEIPYVVSFLCFGLFLILVTPVAIALGLTHVLCGIVILALFALIVKKGLKGACLSICIRSISAYRTLLSLMRTKPLSSESLYVRT